jgi:hypothetical protein
MYALSAWEKNTATERLNFVLINNSDRFRFINDYLVDCLSPTGSVAQDVWYNAAVSFDQIAQLAVLYQNGFPTVGGTDTSFDAIASSTIGAFYWGARANATWSFDGDMQYLYLWDDRALTAAEALRLHTDPYVVLRRRQQFFPAVAAPGIPIPVADYHYGRRRRF